VAALIVIAQSIQGISYSWIGGLSAVLAIFSVWGTIKTYELEIDKIYPREKEIYS